MEKVRVGVLGCGGFARWHLKCLLDVEEAQVVALAEPDAHMLSAARAHDPRLAGVPACASADELFALDGLDAVLISTPHTLHRTHIEAAFSRGLHVLCDKPLTTSSADGEAVIAARDTAGKVGMVSYQRHVEAPYAFLREHVQSGGIGRLQLIQAMLTQGWKRGTVGKWRQDPRLSGGGFLMDSGSHILDAIVWISGLRPKEVSALIDPRDTPVEIDSSISVRFEGGALASMAFVGDAPEWFEEIRFYGDKGAAGIVAGKVFFTDAQGRQVVVERFAGAMATPDRAFVDAVLGKAPVVATFEDALRVVRLTEGAYRSAADGGKPVAV